MIYLRIPKKFLTIKELNDAIMTCTCMANGMRDTADVCLEHLDEKAEELDSGDAVALGHAINWCKNMEKGWNNCLDTCVALAQRYDLNVDPRLLKSDHREYHYKVWAATGHVLEVLHEDETGNIDWWKVMDYYQAFNKVTMTHLREEYDKEQRFTPTVTEKSWVECGL